MPEVLFQRLQQYASQHELQIAKELGSGIHGLVHLALREGTSEESAVKAHYHMESYMKERDAYFRLRQASVHEIRGLNVPQLLDCNDDLRIIEMSVVSKPYLLDFAGVSLDHPMDFSEELWLEWEAQKREQFGHRWSIVQKQR